MVKRRALPPSLAARFAAPPPGAAQAIVAPPSPAASAAAPQGPQTSVAPNVETYAATYQWPGNETTVYTTVQHWRGVDVYLSQTAPQHVSGVFTVRIYARLPAGLRVLVATGRLGHQNAIDLNPFTPRAPIWAAAARGQAVTYEVTLEYRTADPVAPRANVTIAVVASNEANDPPEWVGTIKLGQQFATSLLDTSQIPDPELVWVHAAPLETVVTPRFLHVHDRGTGGFPGASPVFSFPICGPSGNPAGNGVYPLRYKSLSGFLRVMASSTNGTSAIVADCILQAVVR